MTSPNAALRGNVVSLRCPYCEQPQALHEGHGCPPICLECRRPLAYVRAGAEAGCRTCLRELERYLEAADAR